MKNKHHNQKLLPVEEALLFHDAVIHQKSYRQLAKDHGVSRTTAMRIVQRWINLGRARRKRDKRLAPKR